MPSNVIGPIGPNVNGIDDLADVTSPAPADNDTLCYNSATGQWETVPKTATGSLAVDDLSDADTTTVAPTVGQTLVWDGTNWVPGDIDPCEFRGFRSRLNTAANLVEGTQSQIIYATEDYDVTAFYNPATGDATVPAGCDGYYHITAAYGLDGSNSADSRLELYILVNGTEITSANDSLLNTQGQKGSVNVSTTVFLNAGDVVTVEGLVTSVNAPGANFNFDLGDNGASNHFEMYKAGQ